MSFSRTLQILLNPFDTVRYNSEDSPDARTMHTTLAEKIEDVYMVAKGGTAYGALLPVEELSVRDEERLMDDEKVHYRKRVNQRPFTAIPSGLFDLATLGVLIGIHFVWDRLSRIMEAELVRADGFTYSATPRKILAALPYALFGILNFIGNGLLRPLFAVLFTAASLPFILISHAVARVVRSAKRDIWANQTLVVENDDVKTPMPLSDLLVKHKLSLADVTISSDPNGIIEIRRLTKIMAESPATTNALLASCITHNASRGAFELFPTYRASNAVKLGQRVGRSAACNESICQPRNRSPQ